MSKPPLPMASAGPTGRGYHVLELLCLFVAGFALMQVMYGGIVDARPRVEGVPGNDSFYHLKMAAMLPHIGFVDEFPWLRFCYFTREGQAFVSHHAGFHLLLVPFVYLSQAVTGDYLAGGRWAMAVFFALNVVMLDVLLLSGRVRWRGVWLLLFLLLPPQFYVRHSSVRAIGASLVLMQFLVWCLFENRYRWSAAALAAYVHLYLGGVMYGPMLVALFALACVAGPRKARAWPIRTVAWCAGGWLLGVATYPYARGMWEFLLLQVFGSGLSPDIPVGQEWKPYEGVWWFAQTNAVILIAFAGALCWRLRMGPAADARTLFLVLAQFAFLILTMKARRFIEYWPMFALISAAYLTRRDGSGSREAAGGSTVPGAALGVAGVRDATGRLRKGGPWVGRLYSGAVGLALIAGTVFAGRYQWAEARRGAKCSYDLKAIQGAMNYLRYHSAAGDVVFTDDWDIFPVFFYYNTHNHFIVGLDPKFTHERDPELWARYVKTSRGQVPSRTTYTKRRADGGESQHEIEVALSDIATHFGARWVVTDRDHAALAQKLHEAPEFAELVYPSTDFQKARKAPYVVFRVRDNQVGG